MPYDNLIPDSTGRGFTRISRQGVGHSKATVATSDREAQTMTRMTTGTGAKKKTCWRIAVLLACAAIGVGMAEAHSLILSANKVID